MVTREEFVEYLRDGLYHLYDVERLRQSPLTALHGVTDQPDIALALRSILIESVESLKPEDDAPSQSRDWRLYDALFFAYVQQLDQRLVADQLALSVRHLRREQRAAFEVLTDRFWQQFDLEAGLHEGTATDTTPAQTTLISPTAIEELTWLKDLPAEKPTDLNQMLSEVLELAQLLTAQHGVSVEIEADDALPNLAVHPVALNQIPLSVLSVAIPRLAGGQVRIRARPLQREVEIQIQHDQSLSGSQIPSSNDAASLEIARQLTNLCGGRPSLPPKGEDAFSVTLALPAPEQLPVLAIDDNADTLELLQRYTAGTRYRLIGTQDPEQALTLAGKLSPQIIVLDVMMLSILTRHGATGFRPYRATRQHDDGRIPGEPDPPPPHGSPTRRRPSRPHAIGAGPIVRFQEHQDQLSCGIVFGHHAPCVIVVQLTRLFLRKVGKGMTCTRDWLGVCPICASMRLSLSGKERTVLSPQSTLPCFPCNDQYDTGPSPGSMKPTTMSDGVHATLDFAVTGLPSVCEMRPDVHSGMPAIQ